MNETTERIEKIILVYSARAGLLDALLDSSKKLLSVNGCSLCRITHGLLGERDDWKSCRDSLGVAVEYFHRDELDSSLAALVGGALPCVVAQTKSGHEVLMGPEVLSRCGDSVEDFRGRLHHHAVRLGLTLE